MDIHTQRQEMDISYTQVDIGLYMHNAKVYNVNREYSREKKREKKIHVYINLIHKQTQASTCIKLYNVNREYNREKKTCIYNSNREH